MTVDHAHKVAMRRGRAVIRWLNAHRRIEVLPVVLIVALAVVAWRGEHQDQQADERDAARAYQRCEQNRPVAIVAAMALDEYPAFRRAVVAAHPEALDDDGRLPVPDCRRIYPRGAELSARYPDLTPTRSTP